MSLSIFLKVLSVFPKNGRSRIPAYTKHNQLEAQQLEETKTGIIDLFLMSLNFQNNNEISHVSFTLNAEKPQNASSTKHWFHKMEYEKNALEL